MYCLAVSQGGCLAFWRNLPRLPPCCARRTLKSLWASEGVQAKWDVTSQAKKRSARKLRSSANDFERSQIQLARKERSVKRAKA